MDVRSVLDAIDAPPRLRAHGALVVEAADVLLAEMRRLHLTVDETWVSGGAWLHDAGKTLHPNELDAPGALHERAGEALLLAHGVDPRIARCCVSHAGWRTMNCELEELLVALADKLWKGVRAPELETLVIDSVAARLQRDRWDVFVALDTCFEKIADDGPRRLRRS